jgi:GNAT superfamily N-acetyltransferase
MDEVTVRDARPEDLPRLLDLYVQLDPNADNTPPDEWPVLRPIVESITADPRQRLLVAEADGRVIGSLTLVLVLNLTHGGRPWAEVENVVVDEETRQTGVGRILMDRAEAIATETGCYKLQLQSSLAREPAHRFYERGYQTTSRAFRKYFDN